MIPVKMRSISAKACTTSNKAAKSHDSIWPKCPCVVVFNTLTRYPQPNYDWWPHEEPHDIPCMFEYALIRCEFAMQEPDASVVCESQ